MTDFSVILLNYNASEEQIEHTVMSILNQKDVRFEIIICDDGSRDNHFDYIEELMKIHAFHNYTLLGTDKNMGTVRNALRGLEIAKGKYAKLLGMGDLLYCDTTLREVADFMEENNLQSCFGFIKGYRIKDGEIYPAEHKSPLDIKVYRNKDKKSMEKNILIAEDWVSGVCIFATTQYYYKYISVMKDKVIYCEDWATALALIDDEYLTLLERYVVKYEVGDGVSTTSNSAWRSKLLEDNKQFWKVLAEYASARNVTKYDKHIRANRRKKKFDNIQNFALQFLLKAITNPYLIVFWCKVMLNKQSERR